MHYRMSKDPVILRVHAHRPVWQLSDLRWEDEHVPPHFWFNDLDHETRIRTQMLTNAIGEVVMFTLQLELWVEDRWYPVVRYDCRG